MVAQYVRFMASLSHAAGMAASDEKPYKYGKNARMNKALVYGIASACAVALVLSATLEVPSLRSEARRLYYAVRSQHALRVGDVLPPIRLSDLHGLPITLTARRNHVLLINVFATWCVPCQSEMPALAALDRHVPRGVQIVGIDQGEPATRVSSFIQAMNLRYPILLDSSLATSALGATLIPTTIVVGPDERVTHIVKGPMNLNEFRALIARARRP